MQSALPAIIARGARAEPSCGSEPIAVSDAIWPILREFKMLTPQGGGPDVYIIVSPMCRYCKFIWLRALAFEGALRFHWIPVPLVQTDHAYRLTAPLLKPDALEQFASTFLGLATENGITANEKAGVILQDRVMSQLGRLLCMDAAPTFIWKTALSTMYTVGLKGCDRPGGAAYTFALFEQLVRSAVRYELKG